MSTPTQKFLIAYLFMVLVPVLGLVTILNAGLKLSAPLSVEGLWNFEADVSRFAQTPCGELLPASQPIVVTISQSGQNLTIRLSSMPQPVGSGIIDGTRLVGRLPASQSSLTGASGNCLPLSLTANVDPKAQPRTLAGVLSFEGCRSCLPLNFRATRERDDHRVKQDH